MKVLFITSIVYPDIGGPALYARYLPPRLEGFGIKTKVVSLPRLPKIIRECIYAANLSIYIPRHDIIYALSASPVVVFPAVILSKLFRKKMILRPGGDFLWERYMKKTRNSMGLGIYYESGEYKRNILLYRIFSYSLRSADKIIFPAVFLKDLYRKFFMISEEKCEFVGYSFPEMPEGLLGGKRNTKKQFFFAGRLIPLKNIDRLIRAFSGINNKKGFVLKIVGDGPQKKYLMSLARSLQAQRYIIFEDTLSHSNLLTEIKNSYCVIIVSIFELGSFIALECLKLKTPLIFTRGAALYDKYKDTLLFANPRSVEDIRKKMEFLLDDENYRNYIFNINKINTKRGWEEVADEHVDIFRRITK